MASAMTNKNRSWISTGDATEGEVVTCILDLSLLMKALAIEGLRVTLGELSALSEPLKKIRHSSCAELNCMHWKEYNFSVYHFSILQMSIFDPFKYKKHCQSIDLEKDSIFKIFSYGLLKSKKEERPHR